MSSHASLPEHAGPSCSVLSVGERRGREYSHWQLGRFTRARGGCPRARISARRSTGVTRSHRGERLRIVPLQRWVPLSRVSALAVIRSLRTPLYSERLRPRAHSIAQGRKRTSSRRPRGAPTTKETAAVSSLRMPCGVIAHVWWQVKRQLTSSERSNDDSPVIVWPWPWPLLVESVRPVVRGPDAVVLMGRCCSPPMLAHTSSGALPRRSLWVPRVAVRCGSSALMICVKLKCSAHHGSVVSGAPGVGADHPLLELADRSACASRRASVSGVEFVHNPV